MRAALIALVLVACAASPPPSDVDRVRDECRTVATVTERVSTAPVGLEFGGTNLGGGATPTELKRLDPKRFSDCVRASGLAETQFSSDLAEAQKESGCRDRAMSAVKSKTGELQLVFDAAKYQACLAAP